MDDRELGARIAYWRQRRGLTQQLFADRIGRSKSWVEKAEAGTRSAGQLAVLLAICAQLRIDLPVLLGRDLDRDTKACIDDLQVRLIRSALERYDAITGDLPVGYEPDLLRLQRQLTYAWCAFELADYQAVARTLPGLLLDAQRCHVVLGSQETTRLLVEGYQITASTLRKLGEHELAWLAADRGIMLAERSGDLIMAALTAFRLANALTALGQPGPARALTIAYATRLGHDPAQIEARLAVYGNLLLQAAMAAAVDGDTAGVRDLIGEAASVAAHVSEGSNYHRLSFGPANTGIHHVAALVALGEGGLALEAAAGIDPGGLRLLRRERRANHLTDLARACTQQARHGQALDLLLQAEALAPREVHCRPFARRTITSLLKHAHGTPPAALRALAVRAAVTG